MESEAQALTGHSACEIVGRDASVLADRPLDHGRALVAELVRAGGAVRVDAVRAAMSRMVSLVRDPTPPQPTRDRGQRQAVLDTALRVGTCMKEE